MSQATEIIKKNIDLVDYIGRFVDLKKRGKNYFGLCPFHNENTPSFSVNPEMQYFKCFGCGKYGDLFTFVEDYHHVDFPEALEMMAEEAGVKLENYQDFDDSYKEKAQIYEMHERATKFYHKTLLSSKGEKARRYLKNRGLTKETWKEFQIGYAPREYKYLTNKLQKNYKSETIKKAGLVKPDKLIDKFYDRVMFPIFDKRGRAIGFTARVLDAKEKRPKYVNTSETPIFKKRQQLFGLHQAKREIHKQNFAILVEGATDVISSSNVGVKNIVAPLGTSITKEQLQVLSRYTDTIAIAFDNDTAGKKALIRATNLAHKQKFIVKAIAIPYGKDADETIQHDKGLWRKATNNARPIIDYIIENSPTSNLEQKKKVLNFLIPLLHHVKDPVTQDTYVNNTAEALKLQIETIQNLLENFNPKQKKDINKDSTENNNIKDEVIKDTLEFYYLALIIQDSERLKKHIIDAKFIKNAKLQEIYQSLKENDWEPTSKVKESRLYKDLSGYMVPLDDPEKFEKELTRTVVKLKINFYKKKISELSKKAKEDESVTKEINKLTKKLATLQKHLN
jgi:DNA primase